MVDLEQVKYYSERIKKIKCAYAHGRKILAKPFLILAIIELIDEGICSKNNFEWETGCYAELLEAYQNQHFRYRPNDYQTPLFKPFYHLTNDGFWHLSMKNGDDTRPMLSNKALREQNASGHFDEAFWELLQDASVREEFKELIINFFIRKKTD